MLLQCSNTLGFWLVMKIVGLLKDSYTVGSVSFPCKDLHVGICSLTGTGFMYVTCLACETPPEGIHPVIISEHLVQV